MRVQLIIPTALGLFAAVGCGQDATRLTQDAKDDNVHAAVQYLALSTHQDPNTRPAHPGHGQDPNNPNSVGQPGNPNGQPGNPNGQPGNPNGPATNPNVPPGRQPGNPNNPNGVSPGSPNDPNAHQPGNPNGGGQGANPNAGTGVGPGRETGGGHGPGGGQSGHGPGGDPNHVIDPNGVSNPNSLLIEACAQWTDEVHDGIKALVQTPSFAAWAAGDTDEILMQDAAWESFYMPFVRAHQAGCFAED